MNRRSFIKGTFALALSYSPVGMLTNALAAQKELYVVLDDAGADKHDMEHLQRLKDAEVPVTIAVLPYSTHEDKIIKILSQYKNADIMLHQPMEPSDMKKRKLEACIEYKEDKKISIKIGDKTVYKTLDQNIARLNFLLYKHHSHKRIKRINNHQGSAVTADKEIAMMVAKYCKQNRLILVDSNTPAPPNKTKMFKEAKTLGIKAYKRTLQWLDTYKNAKPYSILSKGKDSELAIGHTKYNKTIDAVIRYHKNNPGVLKNLKS